MANSQLPSADEVILDDFDFDLSFDDPPSEAEAAAILEPGQIDPNPNEAGSGHVSVDVGAKSEAGHSSGSQGSNGPHVLRAANEVPSPESEGSGNCSSNAVNNSVNPSPNFVNNLMKCGVVEQEIKLEDIIVNTNKCSSILKRKKVSEDSNNVSKYQISDFVVDCSNVNSEGDEKRKGRLMRNRESAHLSRQRKKQYVEELEDKVRIMHSTIQDLNAKMSYIMSENATLRSQMGNTSYIMSENANLRLQMGSTGVPTEMPLPPVMYPQPQMGSTSVPTEMPPPPGMYPHPQMGSTGVPTEMPPPPGMYPHPQMGSTGVSTDMPPSPGMYPHPQMGSTGVPIEMPPPPGMYPHPQMGSTGVPTEMPPPPGMFPHPPGMYPWLPFPPPYMLKPQGSQVPLVPIPRLKPQAVAPAPKRSKKAENKKTEMETKKVASISFLGLLFFMLLFGGLVPIVNLRYGGLREPLTSRDFSRSGYKERHHGRVLVVDGIVNGSSYSGHHNGRDYSDNCRQRGQGGDGQTKFNKGVNEFINSGNGSEPLMASLYVPRNDKLVKIDGNLIIHSVLASEKAMAHRSGDRTSNGETGLTVPRDSPPAIPGSHPHHYRSPADVKRALSSGDKEKAKLTMQEWFLEGVAGPMLSSGMCTEVFQFDVSSSPGAIVPAATVRNVSMEQRQNATRTNKGVNRRILDGFSDPVTRVPHNISAEHEGRTGKKDDLAGNSSRSSMVVSVLVDPREAGDGDGMIGRKSVSRIFVVVLIDSVKYVTYSCMLPFKGSVPIVTT